VVSLVIYSLLLRQEYLRERFAVSPFFLYLFLSWIRLGLVPIYVAFGPRGGPQGVFMFAGHDASRHAIAGHFLNVLGDLFFVTGYYIYRRFSSQPRPLQFRDSRIASGQMAKVAVILLGVTYVSRVLVLAGVPLHTVGQPYMFFKAYGASAAMLTLLFAILKASSVKRLPLVLLMIAVLAVELTLSLSSYMKQHVIIAMLPVFIYVGINARKIDLHLGPVVRYKRVLLAFAACIFFISVLFTYSKLRRPEFWTSSGVLREERPEVKSFLISAVKSSIHGESRRSRGGGLRYFLGRNNFIGGSGWCYSYVRKNGNNSGKYFKEIPAILIPRILWPEKPLVSRGREIAVLLGQAKSVETATTATGFSMAGCMFWGWGYPCLILGMFVNGIIFFMAWKIFSPSLFVNPISTLICLSLFVKGMRWSEGAFDGNVVYYVIIFALFLPVSILFRSKACGALRIDSEQ
jgi:hypothetical protein